MTSDRLSCDNGAMMDKRTSLIPGYEKILDKLVDIALAAGPIGSQTDKYFTNTSRIVRPMAISEVTFAVFMRRRVVAALEPTIRMIQRLVPGPGEAVFNEGDLVPSESKMLEITGSMAKLSEIETLVLQKIGFPCVSANNAYEMCRAIPNAAFMDMHARHASGAEMNILAAYGAAVGSAAAKHADSKVKGFVGSSQDLTAPLFGAAAGMGTMPHALVGYTQGDVLEAMKLFAETIPEAKTLIALVDYTGEEITDSLRCARWFYEEAKLQDKGKIFGVRLDTHGGRLPKGWTMKSRSTRWGTGWAFRANTISSSRFWGAAPSSSIPTTSWSTRCAASCSARAFRSPPSSMCAWRWTRPGYQARRRSSARPASIRRNARSWGRPRRRSIMVGTGSFLPATLTETYATADIIAYDGVRRVKVGREFLFD